MHLCVPRRVRFLVRYLPNARFTTPSTPTTPYTVVDLRSDPDLLAALWNVEDKLAAFRTSPAATTSWFRSRAERGS
jgi:hypothetical protein